MSQTAPSSEACDVLIGRVGPSVFAERAKSVTEGCKAAGPGGSSAKDS